MAKSLTQNRQLLWRLPLAGIGGAISTLAYPRFDFWPAIFISVIALLVSIRDLNLWRSLLVGFVGGFFFYFAQITWMSQYLGPAPLLALSGLEAIIFAIGMAAIAKTTAWLDGFALDGFIPSAWRPLQISLAVATLWTAREWVAINMPYGGFPWSRLAMSQADSVLGKWVYYGGQPLLSFLIAFISALALTSSIQARKSGLAKPATAIAITATALVFAIPAATVLPTTPQAGSYVIAAVQGNANAGLFANPVAGSILQNHLDATKLIAKSELAKSVNVVVWPENASDINPLADIAVGQQIRTLVDKQLHVPLIFGTVTERGDQIYNSSILWKPGIGATDWYDKKRPVPFAEYVPDRSFWYSLAPDLIGLISRGFSFGTRDGIFDIGKTHLGVLICFEIAIDDISRDLVNQGAQVIISQTNNSDFGHSDETYQQVAIAKLRAIETGRAVVNDSTVGVSAVFAPDGTVLAKLPTFKPGVMVTRVPLRTDITPALRIEPAFNLLTIIMGLALMILSGTWVRFRRKKTQEQV